MFLRYYQVVGKKKQPTDKIGKVIMNHLKRKLHKIFNDTTGPFFPLHKLNTVLHALFLLCFDIQSKHGYIMTTSTHLSPMFHFYTQ